MATPDSQPLQRTPLFDLHVSLGAKMVPFAGYEMPVQYPTGIIAEHLHTRAQAGLFDVSHMGQAVLRGPNAEAALETLVPADIKGMKIRPAHATVATWMTQLGGTIVQGAAPQVRDMISGRSLRQIVDQPGSTAAV